MNSKIEFEYRYIHDLILNVVLNTLLSKLKNINRESESFNRSILLPNNMQY